MGRLTILHDGAPITDITPGSTPIYVPGFSVEPVEPQNLIRGLPVPWLQLQADGVDVGDANPRVINVVADPERLLVTRGVGERSHVATLRKIAPTGPVIPYADVIALLHTDVLGTAFVDDGPNNFEIAVSGAATQAADAGAFGGISMLSPASLTDSIYFPVSPSVLMNPGPEFTATVRMKLAPYAGINSYFSIFDWGDQSAGSSYGFSLRGSVPGNQIFYYTAVDAVFLSFTWEFNRYYHIQICRDSGGLVYLFVDGALIDVRSATISFRDPPNPNPVFRLGYILPSGAVDNFNVRYFNELLLTKTCLNTSAFTPPEGPYIIGANTGP